MRQSQELRIPRTGIVLLAILISMVGGHPYAPSVNSAESKPTSGLETDLFDFEDTLAGWTRTGAAFDLQPVNADTIRTDQVEAVKLGGDYWRNLSYPVGQHGSRLVMTDNSHTGTLTSPEFVVAPTQRFFSFLIAGSPSLQHERLELQILSSSAEDATRMQQALQGWNLRRSGDAATGRISTRDGEYVVALSVTAEESAEHKDLDFLQQQVFELPDFLTGRSARIKVIDDSEFAHIDVDFIQFTSASPPAYRAPVWGYADYHTHPMSHLAFGGLKGVHTLWGDPGGAYDDYRRDPTLVSSDIPHCIKNHGGGFGAEFFINTAEKRINPTGMGQILWDFVRGRLTSHGRSGGPEFHDFPSFLSGAHQQMHITQIRRNYEGGLRLMVAIAVHNQGAEFLASKARKGRIDPSTEKEVVEAQICAIRKLAELNKDWMEIAYSPAQAREIIRHNKLALVLGIEVDRLGELLDKDVAASTEVAYLWALGIRAVSPIHAVDNRLGGAAVFLNLYNWLNDFLARPDFNKPQKNPQFFTVRDGCASLPANLMSECISFRLDDKHQNRLVIKKLPLLGSFPFTQAVSAPPQYKQITQGHKNVNGLAEPESNETTSYGETYIQELMKAGMILDAIHMSDRSRDGLYQVIGNKLASDYPECSGFSFYSELSESCYQRAYPTIVSHVHFRTTLRSEGKDFLSSEYDVSDRNIEMVRRIGGVLGPFVTEDPIEPQVTMAFENNCGMSSKSFAYSFEYGLQKMGGRGLGMATDYIFIPAVAPRFGRNACWGYKLAENPNEERRKHINLYRTDLQDKGVKYDGMMPAKGVKVGSNLPLKPYRMDRRERPFDFNVDGLAHFGLVPDMLQDLKNVGLSNSDFEALFSSAEYYIEMWEKVWRVSGCSSSAQRCQPEPRLRDLGCQGSYLTPPRTTRH